MKHLTVHEYSRIHVSKSGEDGTITEHHARILDEMNARFRIEHKDELIDWYRRDVIRVRNYVGVIQIGDLVLEILPKIHRDRIDDTRDRRYLLYILRDSGMLPLSTHDITHFSTQGVALLDIVLYLFAAEARKQLHKGRVHRYINVQEDRSTIRGKLLVGIHARRDASRQLRFPCRFSEFTANTSLNKLIRTAAQQGWKLTSNHSIRQSLSWVQAQLDDVETLPRPYTSNIPSIQFDRYDSRYEMTSILAERVLRSMAPDMYAGRTDYTSMLFNMNELFEKYIARIWRKKYRGITTFNEQGPREYLYEKDGGRVFAMKPDIVLGWGDQNFETTVIDTKWKLLDMADINKIGVSQADAYQMFAYKHRYVARRVLLLYPHHDGLPTAPGCQAIFRLPTDKDRTLEIWTVDVEHPNTDIKNNTVISTKQHADT